MHALLFDVFNSLIKEINRPVKHLLYYYEKLTFSKLRFYWEENLKKCTTFEEQKSVRYICRNVYFGIIVFSCLAETVLQKRLFWHYRLQLSFIYKTVSQISFNLFWSGDRRLLSKLLRKWGWFNGHNERFPKYLG